MTKRSHVASPVSRSVGLLERTAEQRAIERLLVDAAADAGGLLLVEGHAGNGKSALLDLAVARARATDMTVLRARCAELERDFGFGVAMQLFEPLLAGADDDMRDRLLGGSAALAGPLLERPTTWVGDAADARVYTVLHGLFWLLSNLADTSPVLIVVDDAHWADRPSLRLLLYLLQRLEAMPVAIVLARRLGEPGAPSDLLGQLAAHELAARVRPQALSRDAANTVVVDALPDAEVEFADACWRMTEGNVFLLGELVAAIDAEGIAPTAANASLIGTLAPDAVLRAVTVRLMRLSDDAARIARAVAVLGADAQLRRVAALSGVDATRVAAAADALAASDILRPVEPARPLRFAHPLLASAVYADVGSGERATWHRRAAEILRDEDVAPERVAEHLLPSSGRGDRWVVEILRTAAAQALRQGVPESASSYLRRALNEPPPPQQRPALLHELGVCEAAAGLSTAIGRLQEAVELALDDGERARSLAVLGRMLATAGRYAEAHAALDAVAACAHVSADVSVQAAAEAAALGLLDARRRPLLLGAAAVGERGDGERAAPALLAARAMRDLMLGRERERVLAGLDDALGDDDAGRLIGDGAGTAALPAVMLVLHASDAHARNERLLTVAIARARARGSVPELATASVCRGASRVAQGRLADALSDVEHAIDAERYGWRHFLTAAYAIAVCVLLERGELAAAADAAARHAPQAHGDATLLGPWHEALGWLALAERRDADARRHFDAWREIAVGIDNPACIAAWRSASAHVLVRAERVDEARALADEELALARAFGAPRAIARALRALAVVEAHGGSLDASVALLDEAVATTAGSEARLEHCRTQLAFGTSLRRSGRRSDAGRALGAALELARTCGARTIEECALAELEVAGARGQRAARRGADALSPSERRVVALAVEGLSNREIAEALFVTRKAVEWHLGNAYRKLHVRSRGELAGALAGNAT